MAFRLEKMTRDNENDVFLAFKDLKVSSLVIRSKTAGRLESWVIDRDLEMYIYRLHNVDPRGPRKRFLLSLKNELVVFEIDKVNSLDVTATIVRLPAILKDREAELKAFFQDGFTVGAEEFIGYESQFGPVQMKFAQPGQAQ